MVLPCAPVFDELGYEKQAASALVADQGPAQMRGGAAGVGHFARQGGLNQVGVVAVAAQDGFECPVPADQAGQPFTGCGRCGGERGAGFR
ncbi:hypothetical protein GCM10009540_74110 [Streptomyces turgidiscabies]